MVNYRKIQVGFFNSSKRKVIKRFADTSVLAEVKLGGKEIYWPAILRYDSSKPDEFYLENPQTKHRTTHSIGGLLGLLVEHS